MGDDRRRRRSGEDLISGLPAELLHGILSRLRSARAAARTGVLSRRWRDVWPHLPELLLDVSLEAIPRASFPDAVDGALDGCLAPALDRLSVALSADLELLVPAERVARWLRFAAGRVAGELLFTLPLRRPPRVHVEEAELDLPACGGAKRITLILEAAWRLRLHPPAGSFSALTELLISCGTMDGGEISNLVSARCPRLSKLSLFVELVAVTDITIRSDSLRCLLLRVTNTHRLEVVAPGLEELTLYPSVQAHISAPKLANLTWHGGAYDGRKHRFHDVGRRIRELVFGTNSVAASVMRRFDEVDMLSIQLCIIPQGIAGYQSFANDTRKLTKCKTLTVSLSQNHHGLVPVILHLLRSRSCNNTRKFSLLLLHHPNGSSNYPCPSSCPCRSEDSRRIDGIDLGSLDEVEITSFKGFHEEFEFVELLSRCNARVLKKLVVNCMKPGTLDTKEVCEKVRSMCQPNVKVEFYVFPEGPVGQRVRLD